MQVHPVVLQFKKLPWMDPYLGGLETCDILIWVNYDRQEKPNNMCKSCGSYKVVLQRHVFGEYLPGSKGYFCISESDMFLVYGTQQESSEVKLLGFLVCFDFSLPPQ